MLKMRTYLGTLLLVFLTATFAQSRQSDVRFSFFYSSLDPYGEWVNTGYGACWRPHYVVQHWRPYLYGRWVWTDYGWYWASEEPFGWAVFHYGRWVYDDYYGWIWQPDNVWGPSWVEWRYDDDYVGWAPLPPQASYSASVGITWTDHWVAPVHYWNFVPSRNFVNVRAADYVQPIEQSRRIYGNTRASVDIRAVDNRVVNQGVDPGFVERRTNVRINRVDVVDNSRGNGDRIMHDQRGERIEAYRPHLDTTPSDRQFRRPDEGRNVQPQNEAVQAPQHATPPQWQRESQQRFGVPRPGGSDTRRNQGNQAQREPQFRQGQDQQQHREVMRETQTRREQMRQAQPPPRFERPQMQQQRRQEQRPPQQQQKQDDKNKGVRPF
jgi:hypothetical protein